ncbi:1249_t:CDS:2, partial [Funneliformis caledonium]
SQDFKVFSPIGSGGSASVYAAYWKSTQTKFAIKKFAEGSTKEIILNEIHLMGIMRRKVDFHPNIIRFYGITNFEGCWEHEPDKRLDIGQVISDLNSIDPKSHVNSKDNYESEIIDEDELDPKSHFNSKENDESEIKMTNF